MTNQELRDEMAKVAERLRSAGLDDKAAEAELLREFFTNDEFRRVFADDMFRRRQSQA